MAARLALTDAKITTSVDGTVLHDHANIVIRNNTATLDWGGAPLGITSGVVSVERPQARTWSVTFEDGTVWTVEATRDCGCGARRRGRA